MTSIILPPPIRAFVAANLVRDGSTVCVVRHALISSQVGNALLDLLLRRYHLSSCRLILRLLQHIKSESNFRRLFCRRIASQGAKLSRLLESPIFKLHRRTLVRSQLGQPADAEFIVVQRRCC